MFGCKLVVFEYLADNEVARVASLIQVRVVGGEHFIVPRHIGIGFHLIHIEGGAVVTGYTLIVGQDIFGHFGASAVGQEEVDVVQTLPAPAGIDGDRVGIGRCHDVLDFDVRSRGYIVGTLVGVVAVTWCVDQTVTIHLQVAFGIEIRFHTDFRMGLPIHKRIVARSSQQQSD